MGDPCWRLNPRQAQRRPRSVQRIGSDLVVRAARSDWVRAELDTAISRSIQESSARIIPVRLDDTELPPLIRRFKWLAFRAPEDMGRGASEIMGFANERDRLRAIQAVLDSAQIRVDFYHGYGPIVDCPKCGAGLESIEGWTAEDRKRCDIYAGARCRECGWNDGGEI